MTSRKTILYAAALVAAFASAASAQQTTPPPVGPFKVVHLMNMTPDQEAKYLAYIKDANQVIAKLGCASCAYHVYKVGAPSGGKYNHMTASDWPGRDMFVKVHTADDYKALGQKHPIRDEVEKTQFYDRFVEVK